MIKFLVVITLLLVVVGTVQAQGFETHPGHDGYICWFVTESGARIGNCGDGGSSAAGRGALNFAVWGLNGECVNPTWGGSETSGPRYVTSGTLHTEQSFSAEGPMPYYRQAGETTLFGQGHQAACTSQVSGAGAYLWYTLNWYGNQAVVDWSVQVNDVPGNGCVLVEVTGYGDSMSRHGHGFTIDQPEAGRVGYNTTEPITMTNGVYGLRLYTADAAYHEGYWYAGHNLGKLSSVSQYCGLVAGAVVSGQTTIDLVE